jgi:hypothetical protein
MVHGLLCHEVVAKTKIIIFGAREPYQVFLEFFEKMTDFFPLCAKFFGRALPFFVELPQ